MTGNAANNNSVNFGADLLAQVPTYRLLVVIRRSLRRRIVHEVVRSFRGIDGYKGPRRVAELEETREIGLGSRIGKGKSSLRNPKVLLNIADHAPEVIA